MLEGTDKRRLVSVLAGLHLALSFCFFIAACVACDMCYTSPCEEGDGTQALWKVRRGEGFTAVTSAMLLLAQGVATFYLLMRNGDKHLIRLLSGAMPVIALLLLQLGVVWGSQSDLVHDLKHGMAEDQNGVLVHPKMNSTTRTLFPALTAFASLLFILQVPLTILFLRHGDELSDEDGPPSAYSGGGGAAYGNVDDTLASPSHLSSDAPPASGPSYQST